MSQVITNAFEHYWQSSLAAEQPVVLDEFILADIPNLDITSPIDPDTGLPPESQIVHRQNVDQRGRINNNAVAYTIVMDTTVGDFSFNAMYLRNKANGVIGMIVYKGRETKLKTDQTTGQTGNSLVKSMLMGYNQAAEATLTNVDAGTWQIDYAARLRGQDEDLRQLASQLYGHHTFIGDGFKVVQQDGGHQVTQGVAIVGGLRIELKQPEVIYPGTKPIGVWVDVHRSGSLLSEHQNHFTIITSVADLTDHVDESGYPHYVAKLATVQADSTVIDGRGQGGSGGSGAIPDTFALWKRSMAEAGYNLIGQFGTKNTIETADQVLLSKDGTEVYAWQGTLPKHIDENATPENSGGIGDDAWEPKTGELLKESLASPDGPDLGYKLPVLNAVALSVKAKLNQFVTAADFGITGGGHDETIALRKAFTSGLSVLFPSAIYGHSEHIGIASNTKIIAQSGATLKMLDGVDQVYHSIVSANAMSIDARLADDDNVDSLIDGYVTNICIKGLKVDANYKNRPKTYTDREQGTAIELQAVSHSALIELEVVDGVQHCINVRAGTLSYDKGYDYVAKYPSHNIRIIDCVTDDQLYDDGITTHDSEYIWIERCEAYTPRNASNLDLIAGSNGIEIDDGSRYVWVTDCISDGGFGGYQAKGHSNTPPAHHVWFTKCHAENNHMPFVLAAVGSPSTDLESVNATCHHIYLNDCSIKNAYVFSNVEAWATEAHYLQILNTRHIYINNLSVDGKLIQRPNSAPNGKAIFRAREYNSYVFFNDMDIQNVEERSILGESLFSIEANMKRLVVDGLTVDKFTKAPILFTNSSGPNWEFRRVTLKVGNPTIPVIRVNGVGGGTLYAEKIQGSGFTVGYSLGDTDCQEHTVVNYIRRIASGESGYQKVMGYLSPQDIPTAINTELGTSYSYNVGGVESLMGRVA